MSIALRQPSHPGRSSNQGGKALSGALGGLGGLVASEFGLGVEGVTQTKSKFFSRAVSLFSSWLKNTISCLFCLKRNGILRKRRGTRVLLQPYRMLTSLSKTVLLKVTRDRKTDVITVSIEHKNPEFARSVVDYYLTELSEGLRAKVLKDAQENMRFLTEQLDRTTDPLLREKIYGMLAKEIEKDTFARAQTYYGFYVLDPPIAPDLNKKARPKRSMICILSVVVAFFVAVFLAFFLEYLGRLKTEEPDRYQQLKDGLRLPPQIQTLAHARKLSSRARQRKKRVSLGFKTKKFSLCILQVLSECSALHSTGFSAYSVKLFEHSFHWVETRFSRFGQFSISRDTFLY